MAVELEGLEFQIEAKSEEGTKGIDALTASLGKLKQATKGGLGLGSSVKQLEKLNKALSGFHTEKLESLGRALESVSKLGEVKISGSIAKQLGGIADVMDRITLADVERLEDMGKALRDLGDLSNIKIPKVTVPKTGVAPVTDDGTTPTTTTPATSEIEQVGSKAQEAGTKIHFFRNSFKEIGAVSGLLYPLKQAKSVITSAGHGIKSLVGNLKELYGKFKESGGAVGLFARSLKGAAKGSATAFAATIKTVTALMKKSLIPGFKSGTTKAGQFLKSLARIAMYRAIRFMLSALTKALKEGINNLYQYSTLMGGTFAQSMDRLATSGQYLKNSLGAMAAPIINALAPAIDFVIDKIVTLLNFINMLFARLSGASSFTAAKKNATSYGDSLEKAGGSAAKAAKEIRDATTGIDELNIIMQKDDTGGGGGGGGGADYGSMFEELPIDNSVSDFADKLKQAFDNANWKELGTLIGGKVNEVIDSIDYAAVGSKLGWGINGAIQTVYYFLDTVNFTNIGKHVAEMLNNAFAEIDFAYIGRLMVKAATIIPDVLIGGLMELDWGLVAKSASDILIGLFDEITKWFKKYDWSEIGSTLWQKIKDLLANIDYGGIASSFFTYLGTAIRSAVQFLGGFFGSIGADIKNWWDTEIAGQDWKETAGNLLSAIGEGFVNIGTWVFDHIIDPFCTALLGENVWADVKQAGSDMWAGFTKGITDFFNDPGGWIKTNIVDPFVSWIKDLFGIHSPSTVMAEIGGYIIEGLLNGILAPFKNIGKWVKDHIIDPLVEAFEDSPVAEFMVGVKNTAETWWANVNTWWDRKVGAVKSFTTNVVNNATTWWNNTKTWWSGKVGAVQQFTTSVKNEASTWWSNVKTWWSGKVGAVQQFTTSVKNDSLTWWSNVKTWWSGKVGAVQQFTTSVKNEASTWWSNVKTWWSGKVGAVQSFTVGVVNSASTWWSDVKTWWSNAVDTLWATLSIKLPKVKVSWYKDPIFGAVDLPSFSLEWNAKGGILDGAQIFGMLGNTLLGGGEAGKEAVLPLETHTEWMDTLAEKVRSGLPDENKGGMEYGEFRRALADFYVEYVQGTVSQMATDMNRQANKKEQTTVQVGNRVITDAVRTQEEANGYRFAK